ncbi:ABC-2 family transporter protein [bacterium]|nr:ABC-2 family transporter protein [bacterium]
MWFSKFLSYLRLARAYIKLNWSMQMEYRGAFVSQALAMFLNNGTWLAFWMLFFSRFPVVKGWEQADVVTLWAISAAGFGLGNAFCWNLHNLAAMVSRGELDVWMLYPRSLIPHLSLGKMSATAIGDLAFGYFIYIVMVRPDLQHFLLFNLLVVAVALVFIGFNLWRGSLAFYFGQAEVLSEQWFFAMITFSTYPNCLFDGWMKVVLYTLIPAGFVSGLPVEALRDFDFSAAAFTWLGALAVLASGAASFELGLRRYQSGNLLGMRS